MEAFLAWSSHSPSSTFPLTDSYPSHSCSISCHTQNHRLALDFTDLKEQKEKRNSILPKLHIDQFGGAVSKCSWLSVSAGFTFEDSINRGSIIFGGENPQKFQKVKPEFATYKDDAEYE